MRLRDHFADGELLRKASAMCRVFHYPRIKKNKNKGPLSRPTKRSRFLHRSCLQHTPPRAKHAPKTGHEIGPPQPKKTFHKRLDQATVVWNWMRYLRTQHDQPLLLMNLDETGVPLFNGDRCGNVMKKRTVGAGTNQNDELVQYATTAESRGQATHVAIICDDVSVQPHLPQVIIGAHNLLTVTDCRDLQESLADNVYLLRLKSRWTDRVIMERLIRTVARIVRERCPHKVPVLLLDTAPSHLHPALPCLARRLGMRLVLVPARTAWLLQPCDVYVHFGNVGCAASKKQSAAGCH